MFTKRTTKPGANNKFYITKSKGGYSTCIEGSPKDKDCNTLANCVAFANGRFNEIIGTMKYPNFNCNAKDFIGVAKKYKLEISDKPTLGGIMVWNNGSYGHVEVVEEVVDKNTIYLSGSAYGGEAFYYKKRTINGGKWHSSSNYTFLGCIVNPAVKELKTTTRDTNKRQLEVVIPDLNVRDNANGKVVMYPCPKGIYDVLEQDGDWYKIGDGFWVNKIGVKVYEVETPKNDTLNEKKEENKQPLNDDDEKITAETDNINDDFVKNSQKSDLYYENDSENALLHLIDFIVELIKKIFKRKD